MYKEDLALNNLQWLICHKTNPNQRCSLRRQFYGNLEEADIQQLNQIQSK